MIISFSGFENTIKLDACKPIVLEVQNRPLFARVCQSLLTIDEDLKLEKYTIWDNDKAIKNQKAFIFITNPFSLPWTDRTLIGAITEKVGTFLVENNETRGKIEEYNRNIISSLEILALDLESDYQIDHDWNTTAYLKAFGFGIEKDCESTLLDNLIKFLSYIYDCSVRKSVLFMNIKNFLSEKELENLYEHAIFLKIPLLLLENKSFNDVGKYEGRVIIESDFTERTVNI